MYYLKILFMNEYMSSETYLYGIDLYAKELTDLSMLLHHPYAHVSKESETYRCEFFYSLSETDEINTSLFDAHQSFLAMHLPQTIDLNPEPENGVFDVLLKSLKELRR